MTERMFGLYLNRMDADEPWPATVRHFIRNVLSWHQNWLLRDLVGWQAQSVPHIMIVAGWPPPPPWTLEACPRCQQEVERGAVKVVATYRQDGDRWCKVSQPMCEWCRDDLPELDDWPVVRGDNGRFVAVAECGGEPR